MNWRESLGLALHAIRLNSVRAILTMLGVIIGVASVISMLAIGSGSQQQIAYQLEKMGTNNIIIKSGSATRSGVKAWAGTATRLQYEDALAMQAVQGVISAAAIVDGPVQARHRGVDWATNLEGVSPSYIKIRSWPIVAGSFFTAEHLKNSANVCVLGQTVVRELFGLSDPIGESIIIKRMICKVIGVLGTKGASSWGRDMDDVILAPITTAQRKILGRPYVQRIIVQTEGQQEAMAAGKLIRKLMRQRHRLSTQQDDDFRIHNRADLAAASEESARVFTWLLGSIATISLIVGGIGIMNIMLVSVSERTREIGIRRAIGARRKDILLQFLLESVVLTGTGGLIGVLLGIITAYMISSLSELVVTVTYGSIVVALVFAIMTGILFGLHPALKAARLHPIEALRYE